MTYGEFVKKDYFYVYRVVDKNGESVLVISSYLPESLASEEVEIDEKNKLVRFVNREAVNGQLETGKEIKRHLRDKTAKDRMNPIAWFFLVLLTAIIRCI